MKKTGKKFLTLMLAFVMLFVSAAPAFAAGGEITVTAPSRIIVPKDSETVLRVPFTAELDESTTGFVKTATDADGNKLSVNKVWFDDSYMYYTNALNTSINTTASIKVTSSKGEQSVVNTIYVEPYIYEDFEKYSEGTKINTGNDTTAYTQGNVTPETTGYFWTSGYSVKNSVAKNTADNTKYLSTISSSANWSSRIDMNPRIVADYRDVVIDLDLYIATMESGNPIIIKGSDEATNTSKTEYLMYLKKNDGSGKMELLDSAQTTVLKTGIEGSTFNLKIVAHMDKYSYDAYANGEQVVKGATLSLNKINQILFSYRLEGFEIYSGEKVTPLTYTVNEEFTGWQDGVKYYNGGPTSFPTDVNSIIVEETADASSGYFSKTTKDEAAVLESYFAPASTIKTQNVRYSGLGIGSKFLVEYKIFIENNGIRVGVAGAPSSNAANSSFYPEIFYFENDGYFRSGLLTGDSYLGSYRLNEWNTVQLAADTTTGKYSIYLNGYPMVTDAVNDDLKGYGFATIRHNVFMRSQNGNAHRSYLDYIKVANIGEGLNIDSYRTDFTFDNMLVLNQDVLIGENEIDVAQLISAITATGKSVSVKNAAEEVVTTGNLEDGYKIYVTSANGKNTCCYVVSNDKYKLHFGKSSTTADNGTTSYEVSLTVNSLLPEAKFAPYVIVAEYNQDKELVNVSMNNKITDGKITVNYTPESDDDSIMAFAWESFDTLVPLTSEMTVK